MTVGSVPPRPYAAGPGSAPALRGPTASVSPPSIHAMLPPPAPMVTILHLRRSIGVSRDHLLGGQRCTEPLDQAHVGARAAHVVCDQVLHPQTPTELGPRRPRPRRGPKARSAPGDGARSALVTRRSRASGRWSAQIPRGEARLEPLKITIHQRADVGVQHRGAEPLVLADFRKYLARGADPGAGRGRRERLAHGAFVRIVGEAVEEAYRDAFRPRAAASRRCARIRPGRAPAARSRRSASARPPPAPGRRGTNDGGLRVRML